jgi:hypothetical protein
MLKTYKEMCEDETICDYCRAEPGVFGTPNGYTSCEGNWCEEAYQRYLEENDVSERAVKISKKIKITIERKER